MRARLMPDSSKMQQLPASKLSLILSLELGHDFLDVAVHDPHRGLRCVYTDSVDLHEEKVSVFGSLVAALPSCGTLKAKTASNMLMGLPVSSDVYSKHCRTYKEMRLASPGGKSIETAKQIPKTTRMVHMMGETKGQSCCPSSDADIQYICSEKAHWESEIIKRASCSPLLPIASGTSREEIQEEYIVPVGTVLDSMLHDGPPVCNALLATSTGLYDAVQNRWTLSCPSSHRLPQICNQSQLFRIATYLQTGFDFSADCKVLSCIPASVASYLSFSPSAGEGVVMFDQSDCIIVPTASSHLSMYHLLIPNPLYRRHDDSTKPWLAVVNMPEAGTIRDTVRKTYTKTWRAFDHLVQAVCPGGSVGLDDKLFTMHLASPTTGGQQHLRRFENGILTAEFSDVRANARCTIEGQALSIRKTVSQILASDRQANQHECERFGACGTPRLSTRHQELVVPRWYAFGVMMPSKTCLEIYGHALGAPIYTHVAAATEKAEESSQGNSDSARRSVSRASLGAVYFALYLSEENDGNATSTVTFSSFVKGLQLRTGLPEVPTENSIKSSTLARVDEGDEDEVQSIIKTSAGGPAPHSLISMPLGLHGSRPVTLHHPRSFDNRNDEVSFQQHITSSTSAAKFGSDVPSQGYQQTLALDSYARALVEERCHTSAQAERDHEMVTSRSNSGRSDLVQVAEVDEHMEEFYAAMLEEHIRLASLLSPPAPSLR